MGSAPGAAKQTFDAPRHSRATLDSQVQREVCRIPEALTAGHLQTIRSRIALSRSPFALLIDSTNPTRPSRCARNAGNPSRF